MCTSSLSGFLLRLRAICTTGLHHYLLGMTLSIAGQAAVAQTTILSQGFEAAACTDWGYTGGNVNTLTKRSGNASARVGRCSESNTLTFNTVNVSGLTGLQLSLYHSVRDEFDTGPGMDSQEGAVMQVSLNGGGWISIGQVGGFSNHKYDWTAATGGSPSGCNGYQCPNPLIYNVPAATNTLALRVVSVNAGGSSGDPCINSGGCSAFTTRMTNGTANNFSRSDEGFYVDDVRLTTTSPVASIPRTWTGQVNTDWHECRNWRYGLVPDAASTAMIDQTSVNNCEIFNGNAFCSSLSLSSNNSTVRNLTIRANRTLTVTNGVSVTRTGSTTAMGITLNAGGTGVQGHLVCGDLTLTGHAPGGASAYLRNKRNNNDLLVRGDLTIAAGGLLDLEGATAAQNGILRLEGDWNNWDSEAAFMDINSRVRFEGGQLQAINTTGFEERFRFLEMQKSANDLQLGAPVRLTLALAFTTTGGGRVLATSTDPVTFEAAAQVNNANDAGHVDGPVRKFGTAAFTFPIGKDNVYRPLQISNIAGTATDAFTAEYIHTSASIPPFGPLVENPPLDHASDCEHWSLERSSGMPDAQVTLSWHSFLSCGVGIPSELRVARWDGTRWGDRGNNGHTATAWGGWVPSSDVLFEFGSFALASTTSNNPLPIELLHFDAVNKGSAVHCAWATASERDNDHFTVERSANGTDFTEVGRVQAAGNSSSVIDYGLLDPAPFSGLSYYRLRQTDIDGTNSLSQVVPVYFEGHGITVLNDGGTLQVLHDMSSNTSWQVFDAVGRLMDEGRTGNDRITLQATEAPAMRLIVLRDGTRVEHKKVLY